MANSATVLVRFLGESKGAKAAAKEASGAIGGVRTSVEKLKLPAALAAAGVAAVAVAAGKAASDAQQSLGSVESVFGRFSSGVVKSSEAAASSVGLSANAYRELAAKIGGQLKNAGVPMDQLAGKTDQLIRQGADLAATFGGPTTDAVDALGAALRGEADPAERYALRLNQNTVNAQILADTTAKLTAEAAKAGKPFKSQAEAQKAATKAMNAMTPAQLAAAKAQATMALVTKQSADSTGQFAREADTAQGQQQRLTASYQDAAAAIGAALLPVMTALASVLVTVANFAKQHPKLFWAIVAVIGALAVAILVVNAALGIYTTVVSIAGAATAAAWLAAIWPIALVIAAVVAIIVVIVLLWNKCAWFRNAVIAVWNAIRAATAAVVGWLVQLWQTVWTGLQAGVSAVVGFFTAAFGLVRSVMAAVVGFVMAAWARVWPFISAGLGLVSALFRLYFAVVAAVVRVVAGIVMLVWQVAFALIRAALAPVIAAMRAGFTAVGAVVRSVASIVSGVLGAAFRAAAAVARVVGAAIAAGFRVVIAPIMAVVNALRGPLMAAFNAVKSIAGGIGSAISSGLSAALSMIHSITSAVQSLIGWLGKIHVPKISLPFGLGKSAPGAATFSGTMAPRVGTTAVSSRAALVPGATIIIQAVDPESAARTINKLQRRHTQRVGLTGTLRTA